MNIARQMGVIVAPQGQPYGAELNKQGLPIMVVVLVSLSFIMADGAGAFYPLTGSSKIDCKWE